MGAGVAAADAQFTLQPTSLGPPVDILQGNLQKAVAVESGIHEMDSETPRADKAGTPASIMAPPLTSQLDKELSTLPNAPAQTEIGRERLIEKTVDNSGTGEPIGVGPTSRTRQAPTPGQSRAAKRSRPATEREVRGSETLLTPAAVDTFLHNAIPVFPTARVDSLPQTPVGRSRRSRSTPGSGGTLDYVTPGRHPSPIGSRARSRHGTPLVDGSPVDLRQPGWDQREDREGQVVMLTEAQLQRLLRSYGRNVPRDGECRPACSLGLFLFSVTMPFMRNATTPLASLLAGWWSFDLCAFPGSLDPVRPSSVVHYILFLGLPCPCQATVSRYVWSYVAYYVRSYAAYYASS